MMSQTVSEVYRIELGGLTTTDQIAQAWREAGLHVDPCIAQVNFPLNPHAADESYLEFIDPGGPFSLDEALGLLEAADLDRPTVEHALRFAEQYGTTTTGAKPNIVFLHEAWFGCPDNRMRFMCVDRLIDARQVVLAHPTCRFPHQPFVTFPDGCVLVGIRRRKQPPVN